MMMRKLKKLVVLGAALGIGNAAYGFLVFVDSQDGPQDPLLVNGMVHELGEAVFPQDELIATVNVLPVSFTSCFEGQTDDPGIPNVLVSIQNLTNVAWPELYYVADPETSITNDDGLINGGLAFRIDSNGINRPLVSESLIVDNVFQPGEVWEFILQDYGNALGGPPAPFDSLGVGAGSGGWQPSTGSIITPEPGLLGMLMLGMCVLLRRRR